MGTIRGSGDDQSYGASVASGTMAAGLAAAAEVWQFRWTSSTLVCCVKSVRVWAGSIVGFAAGFTRLELVAARAWTAAGTGGATATITGNNGKRRTVMATTALGELRVATTAALTAGTKTLDAQGLSSVGGSVTATAGDIVALPTELCPDFADFPIVLGTNEGLVIRATVPATGTWTFGVDVLWTERAP